MSLEAWLAAIAAALLVGFGGGWTVKDWKDSGDLKEARGVIATQKQSLATLDGANKRCTAGVEDVKTAVKGFIDAGTERAAAAQAAMERAAAAAQGHEAAAKSALNRVQPAKGKECETAAAEATAYAKKRKGEK